MGVGLVATVVVLSVVTVVDLGLPETVRNIVLMLPLQIGGLAGTAVGFLWANDRGLGYVRLRKPSLKHLGIAFGSIFAMLAAVIGVTAVLQSLGQQAADHATTQQIESDPTLALYMIPLALFVIGPCEELLFRGVIQGLFRRAYGIVPGIVAAGAIFGLIHWVALVGQGSAEAYVAIAFLSGVILGAVYELTGNILVPIAVHSLWNCIVYVTLYSETVGSL